MSRIMIVIATALCLLATKAEAQKIKYTWDPTGKLVIGVGGGLTKYFGEFTDQHFGSVFQAHLKYYVIPEIAIQADGGFFPWAIQLFQLFQPGLERVFGVVQLFL